MLSQTRGDVRLSEIPLRTIRRSILQLRAKVGIGVADRIEALVDVTGHLMGRPEPA
jgi:hypothetical protein